MKEVKDVKKVKSVVKKVKLWISKCPYDMKDEWEIYGYGGGFSPKSNKPERFVNNLQ